MSARRSPIASIIVHGGAAAWPRQGEPDEDPAVVLARREAAIAGCRRAAEAGAARLERGESALDAVEAAVRVLEDDETFNAGYGAVLTREGTVEHDACIIDGALRAGAVAALPGYRNPISIARRLLEGGEHVMLVGEGASRYAAEQGFSASPPGALIAPRPRARWEARRRAAAVGASLEAGDTVGACAVDGRGRVAAATSTGGTPWKRAGRVGDSPVVGAGAFADDRLGAISATGHGESILRVGLSRSVAERVRAGDSLDEACRYALAELVARTGGSGGLIAVDPDGAIAHATCTPQMPWAAVSAGLTTSGIEP